MATEKLTSLFIVDDSEIERSMLTDYLAKYKQLEIKDFSNGEYCLKEIITGNLQEPDFVLMDYFLDGTSGATKDGLEILSKLKEVSPDTKVIMFTSVNNERIMALAKSKGAFEYIVKGPNSHQQLDTILEKHFHSKKQKQH